MKLVLMLVLQRTLYGVLTLFVVSVIIFVAIDLLPGDFAHAILGQMATPDTVAAFRHQIGLDRPLLQRYAGWMLGVLHGDFGESFATAGQSVGGQRPVTLLIAPRIGNTFFLAGLTALIAVPLSLALGTLAALYRNSIFDRAVNVVALTSISLPEFFVAYLLMLYLAVRHPLFDSISTISDRTPFFESVYRCALPVMTLILVTTAHMMRMTRASILNLLANPYVEMARLKGLPPYHVILRHALPNALPPIVNVVAINLAYLITGVVVVEVVFAFPGIGQLMVDAVSTRDIPVVQACALIFAAVYILVNLIADILSMVCNPLLLHPR